MWEQSEITELALNMLLSAAWKIQNSDTEYCGTEKENTMCKSFHLIENRHSNKISDWN